MIIHKIFICAPQNYHQSHCSNTRYKEHYLQEGNILTSQRHRKPVPNTIG